MSESRSHKEGKGSATRTEVSIPGNRRLDAIRGTSAIEVERSGQARKIDHALSRLATLVNRSKILRVPRNDMSLTAERVKQSRVNVTQLIKNDPESRVKDLAVGDEWQFC